jgi:cytochrome P450
MSIAQVPPLASPTTIPGLPLVGNILDIARNPLEFAERLQRDYGDFAAFSLGKGNKTVLISDPHAVKQVLLETGKSYNRGDPTYAMRTVLGNGLVTSEGDFWKRQRKLAAPAFQHNSLNRYADLMVMYTQEMMARWQSGAVYDLYEEMTLLAQRIIMKALFDVDVQASAKEAGSAFDAMMHGLGAEMNGLDAVLPSFIPTPSRRQMTAGVDYINGLLLEIIEKRRGGGSTKDDLLTMLMGARDEEGKPMSDTQLLDEIRTLYLAGHETTANTLSWSWLLLSQKPEVYATLEAEIDAVLEGRAATFEDVQHLPYCNAVIKESLRCYPAAWVFQRMALEDVELSGYAIPKGTFIWISPWVLHHDARWYEEPNTFMPERWLKEKQEQPLREAYIPFGGGPRICIGNGFAMMEGVLLLATMVQQYRVALLPNHPVEIGVAGTIRPKHGVKATVTERPSVG